MKFKAGIGSTGEGFAAGPRAQNEGNTLEMISSRKPIAFLGW